MRLKSDSEFKLKINTCEAILLSSHVNQSDVDTVAALQNTHKKELYCEIIDKLNTQLKVTQSALTEARDALSKAHSNLRFYSNQAICPLKSEFADATLNIETNLYSPREKAAHIRLEKAKEALFEHYLHIKPPTPNIAPNHVKNPLH